MINFRPYLIGAALGACGFVFLPLSGLLPFSAEPGQLRPVEWYFNLAAQQSITLRSLMTEVPPLDEPGMVQRGAGHYEMVCAHCHGSPVEPAQQIAQDMSPSPPPLVEQMAQWHPEARVFTTIKHGIRRTAMPGWPTLMRDDEVWDMVAFLYELPELDAAEYAAMTPGVADNDCARCHGEEGEGRLPGVPRLDIQTPAYLAAQLRAFRVGARESGTMIAAARTLSDEQIEELARYYGRSAPVAPEEGPAEAAQIARLGVPERDIPACESCHGPNRNPLYPQLDGQDEQYLLKQLVLFKHLGAERGGPNAHIMAEVVREIEREQMELMAEWYGR
ncbi:MAG TPA: c-type cytochrome [Devosia sp.]|jgi:cytochrome c553|nr:c-type cytochrome [Devosia sp.]